jgi:hypothetical protein
MSLLNANAQVVSFIPDCSTALGRVLAKQHTQQNCKPKVGVLSSSQRTALKTSYIRNTNKGANLNDVNNALRRVRNAGAVPPKKKSQINVPAVNTSTQFYNVFM